MKNLEKRLGKSYEKVAKNLRKTYDRKIRDLRSRLRDVNK